MTKSMSSLGSCVITTEESLSFAAMSGDYNPLHLDPISARRYQFGSTLIHGVNGTLRALEKFFATQQQSVSLTSLQVLFSKPVQQGDEIECLIDKITTTSARIEVHSQGKKVQTIDVSFIPGAHLHSNVEPSSIADNAEPPTPNDISMEQAASLSGSVPLVWNPVLFAEFFPQLAKKLPDSQCATILGTTNIVGMICPGLNSVYARLNLAFDAESNRPTSQLDYRVESTDPRFSRVAIVVSNVTAAGEIEAFFRPAPIKQTSFGEIKTLVQEEQFAGQHALIVGGSRGLGEVTAKLLAAGGATTRITFANGRDDAMRVASEISHGGGLCHASQFDILNGETPEDLFTGPDNVTDIYYMASPLIEKSSAGLWDANLFNKYTDFYIRGLADLLAPLTKRQDYRNAELGIYLPSTVFLDTPQKGFAEYIVAKAAVESFAEQLRTKYPNWLIRTPRLPRMLTDQTSGIAGLCPLDSARHILASLQG